MCRENGLTCETLNGKSNIFRYLKVHKNEKILVIADGAAFGSEMDRVMRLMESRKKYRIILAGIIRMVDFISRSIKKCCDGEDFEESI